MAYKLGLNLEGRNKGITFIVRLPINEKEIPF